MKKEFLALWSTKFIDPDGSEWSQERVGEAMGVSQTQVSEVRRGKNAGTNFLIALSQHTGKTINELLGPTAPASASVSDIAAEAITATVSFIDLHQRRGLSYAGELQERFFAMRSAVEKAQKRAGIWLGQGDPTLAAEAAAVAAKTKAKQRKAG